MIQWTTTSFLGHQKVEAANPSQRASLSWYQCVAVARHCLPSCHPCFAQRPTSRRREAPWWGHSHSIPKPRRPQHWCGISTIQKKIPRFTTTARKALRILVNFVDLSMWSRDIKYIDSNSNMWCFHVSSTLWLCKAIDGNLYLQFLLLTAKTEEVSWPHDYGTLYKNNQQL